MKKKCAAFIFGILITGYLSAQHKIIIYYNQDWKITSSEKFQFKREAEIDFSTLVFNGKFVDYNHEGKLVAEGQYLNGVKIGNHKTYFDDGTLKSSMDWVDGDFSLIEWKGESPEFSVSNGTGKFKMEYVIGVFKKHYVREHYGVLSGVFKNKERVGKWIYSDSLGNSLYEETYNHGNFKRAIRFVKPDMIIQAVKDSLKDRGWQVTPDEKEAPASKLKIDLFPYTSSSGDFDLDKTKYNNLYSFISQFKQYCDTLTNAAIRYPGIGGYASFISKEIRYPAQARRNHIQGIVIIRIIVDKDGVVKSYKILRTDHEVFNNEALRIAKLLEDKWLPAHNRCVTFESIVTLPVVFKL